MKLNIRHLLCLLALFCAVQSFAQEQQEPPNIYELAESEADRLQKLLDLEDWQVFYVDSTLKHDWPQMRDEMDKMNAAKVANTDLYIAVQDKWMEHIELSFKKIFDEEQWNKYLKSGAAKAQKQRDKRKGKK